MHGQQNIKLMNRIYIIKIYISVKHNYLFTIPLKGRLLSLACTTGSSIVKVVHPYI